MSASHEGLLKIMKTQYSRIHLINNYLPILIALFFFTLSFAPSTFAQETIPTELKTNFAQILDFAQLSSAAYQDETSIEILLSQRNEQLTEHGSIAGYQVSYFLATDTKNKSQFLAIRGTSNVENALADIALQQVVDKHTGIPLHRGFALSARDIYAQVGPKLIKNFSINITGHSLGGAVAVVLAMYLDIDNYNVKQVVTFGQPKVTNVTGALKFKHLPVIRVVTPKDVVPLVPPFDPVDIKNINIYWHLGEEIILLDKTNYTITSGVKSMLRATRFLTVKPSKENLLNHHMAHYINLLKNKIDKSTYIEYKSNFSIYNLFNSE